MTPGPKEDTILGGRTWSKKLPYFFALFFSCPPKNGIPWKMICVKTRQNKQNCLYTFIQSYHFGCFFSNNGHQKTTIKGVLYLFFRGKSHGFFPIFCQGAKDCSKYSWRPARLEFPSMGEIQRFGSQFLSWLKQRFWWLEKVIFVESFELRKKPSYFPLYWLVYRDPYVGL